MSELSSAPGAPRDAVLVDLSDADAAEKSLRDVAGLSGEILFYKVGSKEESKFYAIEKEKGPSFIESKVCRVFDSKARRYANDEVGEKLADLFPGGPGARLKERMNFGWFKLAVDSSAFAKALDREITDRSLQLRQFLDGQLFPHGDQGKPLMLSRTYHKCAKHINQTVSSYRRREVPYSEARAHLQNIESQYEAINAMRPSAAGGPSRGINPNSPIHLLNRNTAGAYTIAMLARRLGSWQKQQMGEQTPETLKSVKRRLASHLTGGEMREIAGAGLANKALLRLLNKWPEDAGGLAVHFLDRARVINRSKDLETRLMRLASKDIEPGQADRLQDFGCRLQDLEYFPTVSLKLEELRDIDTEVRGLEKQVASIENPPPDGVLDADPSGRR